MPFVSLPLLAQASAGAPASEHGISVVGDTIVVQTSTMSMVLSIPEKGAILNVTDALTGQYLKLNQSITNFLWGVDNFTTVTTSSQADQFNYTIDQTSNSTDLLLAWQIPSLYDVHALVEARADGYIGMKLNVTNLNPGTEIKRVIFPYIGGIQSMGASSGDDLLSIPEREGYVIQNVTQSVVADPTTLEYPGTLSMQYVYFYEQGKGGIYLGMQDSQSNYKGLELLKAASNAYSFDWYQYAANITMGNSYQMGYFAMFKGVAGTDWSAGAQVYKDWALNQWYVSAGPVAQRTDIPTWVKDLDLVWGTEEYVTNQTNDQVYLDGTNSSQMGAFMGQVRSMLPNANMMLYWFGWNRGGFDRGYPDFYPPRDGAQAFQQAINATHALGIKVMLYFNGRLVDDTTPTYQQSLQYLTVDQNGAPYIVSYDNGTLTGGIPAPSTSWWVDEVENFTVTAVKDYGVDGVFLDQSTVASPVLDMSTTHGHLPGGGSWWWQAESSLLEGVRTSIRQYSPQAIVSSENVNEVYIKDVDLFQSYDYEYDFENLYPQGFSAPLFAYVYHGYTLQFTGYLLPFGVSDYAEGSYLHGVAQSIANGYIPGVNTGLAPSDVWWFTRTTKSVLETVVNTRQAFKQFLTYGTAPLPPLFQTSSSFFLGAPVFARNLTAPSITSGAFVLPDGREAIVLANMAGDRKTESGTFPDGLVAQSSQTFLVTEALDNKTTLVFLMKGSAPFDVTIPPLSVETLTLEPEPSTTILTAGSQRGSSDNQLYPLLFSSSSVVRSIVLNSTELSPSAASASVVAGSLSLSVDEPSAHGFVHLVLPNDLLGLSASAEGAPRTFLDGALANATVFQNSTTASVLITYGKGAHEITIGAPVPPAPAPTTAVRESFFTSLTQQLHQNEVTYLGVGGLLVAIGIAAVGSFTVARHDRRRKGD